MALSDVARAQRKDLLAYLSAPPPLPPVNERMSKRLARRVVPEPVRPLLARAATDLMRARERRRAARLSTSALRLHLGSAALVKEGWVNIDFVGHRADLAWNLLRPLPFSSASAEAVFHEHVLEHFSARDGLWLLEECFRVLRPGGVMRVGVPDAGAYAKSYIEGGVGIIQTARPGRPTPMIAFAELVYSHGHRWMYDGETLALFMSAAGFKDVEQRSFGESAISPVPDSAYRRAETIYVEGTRCGD
jgi:predicted SAM-dependent methyltransferase